MKSHALVICLGNELVADDAAGFEVFRRLTEHGAHGARLEYCRDGGVDMLQLLEGETQLIVVDAVQFDSPPGTIHVIPWDSLHLADTALSAHGLGLRETITLGRLLYPEKIPRRITLVGIEGRCFNLTRDHMTGDVTTALDTAVSTVKELLEGTADG